MNPKVFADFDIVNPDVKNGTVIEASAGTGKTFSVAAFVAREIATRENIRIGNILVTTFTRNAAAELRDRVRRRLVSLERQLRSGAVDTKDVLAVDLSSKDRIARADRLSRAVREFDTATISTIHSVCARILAMAGLPSVGDGDEADIDAIINEVVNDAVISCAEGEVFLDETRLREVVRKRLGAPMAHLAYAPFTRKSNGVEPAVRNARLDLIVKTVEECVDRIRERTRLQPTFDDMLRRAAEVLQDRSQTSLLAALRQRFIIAVVDEAQDTDKLQWGIFQGIFDADSTTHTLLAVGDPKQAIYRFRGADVQAYLSVRDDDKRLTLRRNWRSDAGLIEALNHLFEGWEFGQGIEYVPVLARDGAPDSAIIGSAPMTIIDIGTADAKAKVVRPAARRVREILATVKIKKDGRTLPVRPRDICVLVTNKGTGAAIESELRDLGVGAVSSGTENVMAGEMAASFARLLKAMEEPHDTSLIRLASATPFFGDDLADAGSLSDARIDEIQREVNAFSSVLRRKGVAALASRLRADSVIARRLVEGPGGERRETDFAHLVELLHAATFGSGCTPGAVLLAVAELAAREDQSETVSRRVESDRDAVQIMTVHASKGLEFPVVVVADLWKKKRKGNGPNVFHRPDPADPSRQQQVIDAGYVDDRTFDAAKKGRVAEEADEVLRLFYVAMTRAKHHVSLVVGERSGGQHDGGERVTRGMTEPGRFGGVESIVDIVDAALISSHPRYDSSKGAPTGLIVAPFTASTDQTYQRLSFSSLAKRRDGRQDLADGTDDRSGAGHNDDDDRIISIRSGYTAPGTEPGVGSMPLARLTGGTYFGKVMHSIYEKIDFAEKNLEAEVARVVESTLTGSLLRNSGAEIINGIVLSLRTPLGGLLGSLALSGVDKGDRLNELSFEMGLAAADDKVTLSHMGHVLMNALDRAGRGDDILMPYARELASGSFAIPLVGLMNGSIDTLIRVKSVDGDRLFVTDWKSNRLDEDGMDTMIQGYDRKTMLAEMEHHHYPLQALIYGTAVHRYVRSRTPAGAVPPMVDGLAYFFIRGMVGDETPVDADGNRHGVFTWQAPEGLWQELSDVMSAVGK